MYFSIRKKNPYQLTAFARRKAAAAATMPVTATFIVPINRGRPVILLLKKPKKINAMMVTMHDT